MPITTYLTECEVSRITSDKRLNQLVNEACVRTGRHWVVNELTFERKRWFRRPVIVYLYTLYVQCGSEWQVINFYRDHDWSINTLVSADLVYAFLYGVLNGEKNPVDDELAQTIRMG